MENICKNCVFYKSEHLYKYGECSKILDSPPIEDIGLKLNPNRDIDNKEDYTKSFYMPDVNSDIVLDKIIFHDGGHYDAISVGEYFSCIHFKDIRFKQLEELQNLLNYHIDNHTEEP